MTLSLWSGDIHICSGDLQISFKTQDLYCKVLKSPSLEYVLCSSSLVSASPHRVLPISRQSANVVHQRIQVFTAALSTKLLVARVQVSATISTCYNRIPLVHESAGKTTLQLSFRSSVLDVLKVGEASGYNLDSPLEGQLRSCLLGSGMWEEDSQWIFPITNMSHSKNRMLPPVVLFRRQIQRSVCRISCSYVDSVIGTWFATVRIDLQLEMIVMNGQTEANIYHILHIELAAQNSSACFALASINLCHSGAIDCCSFPPSGQGNIAHDAVSTQPNVHKVQDEIVIMEGLRSGLSTIPLSKDEYVLFDSRAPEFCVMFLLPRIIPWNAAWWGGSLILARKSTEFLFPASLLTSLLQSICWSKSHNLDSHSNSESG